MDIFIIPSIIKYYLIQILSYTFKNSEVYILLNPIKYRAWTIWEPNRNK